MTRIQNAIWKANIVFFPGSIAYVITVRNYGGRGEGKTKKIRTFVLTTAIVRVPRVGGGGGGRRPSFARDPEL